MDITYLGHSCFKIRGKGATVVTDPYDTSIGLTLPRVSADVVTLSHNHGDHAAADRVSGTARREEPYIISAPGEYEIQDVSVFGWGSYHDDARGEKRGKNVIYVIHIDNVRVCHLGDLGHDIDAGLVDDLGEVDVLLVPVGGIYTIDPAQAVKIAKKLQPGVVIPMHYKTKDHDEKVFGEMAGVDKFVTAMDVDKIEPVEKLSISETDIPEETEVVVLSY